ncbi:hypothetical protein [Adhaeribacter soli]|uniref:Uncharacterized protein n=1 Tax=Adhaeribacter soli TaxID=2607655 RepID=A0A5N1J8I6_9BACT|nr:hypothetical protein [Adhaeribacter soli]KAA9345595.1 hypothetical protein F0P94_00460 [Adhaeribacter soli]
MACKNRKTRIKKKDVKKYRAILTRLHHTIDSFKDQVAGFDKVQTAIAAIKFDFNHPSPYVNHISTICSLLAERTKDSFILQHIHHNLCQDLELLKEGGRLNEHLNSYFEHAELFRKS